ncbi:MAG: hypothetical protein PF693_02615 [Spirochaetia bacterium]|jgi:hypothetical protein|nr:hypothetical protein [Spirochaetia bacterium]
MRRKSTKMIILVALMAFVIGTSSAFADSDSTHHDINLNVSEIAVLGLNNDSSITLSTPGTVAAGALPTAVDTDSSKYLKYTSVVGGTATRSITVSLGEIGVPSGTQLTIEADDASTTQDGTPASVITLSSTAASLITGISSCATGTDASDGANLTYSYSVTDVTALLDSADATVTVTFTLGDDS